MIYTAEFLNNKTTVTEKQLKTFSNSKLVTLLNKKGFNLGSGHDGMEIHHINHKLSVLVLVPFVGAPTQKIEFRKK